jgi:hypothetical protein
MNFLSNFDINTTILCTTITIALLMAYNVCQKSAVVKRFLSIKYKNFKVKARNFRFIDVIIAVFIIWVVYVKLNKLPDQNKKSPKTAETVPAPPAPSSNNTSPKIPSDQSDGTPFKKQGPHPRFLLEGMANKMVLFLNEAIPFDNGNLIVRKDGNTLFFEGNIIGIGTQSWEKNNIRGVDLSFGNQFYVTQSNNKSWRINVRKNDSEMVTIDTASFIKPTPRPFKQKPSNSPSSILQAPKQNKKDTLVHIHVFNPELFAPYQDQ